MIAKMIVTLIFWLCLIYLLYIFIGPSTIRFFLQILQPKLEIENGFKILIFSNWKLLYDSDLKESFFHRNNNVIKLGYATTKAIQTYLEDCIQQEVINTTAKKIEEKINFKKSQASSKKGQLSIPEI